MLRYYLSYAQTVSVCKVGGFRIISCQVTQRMKLATTPDFTTCSANIFYHWYPIKKKTVQLDSSLHFVSLKMMVV
jgi:hypothetical protein